MKSTVETKIIELVKLGHELAKELHCAESAALISDLASQLEVQFARSNALAAENAGLNKFIAESCFVQAGEIPSWHQAIDHAPETPTTSAFLAEVRAGAIPEGYVLVPQEMHLSSEAMEGICFHCGDGGFAFGEFTDGLLFVGAIDDSDGQKIHGLHIATADYPEEGCATICEFLPAPTQGAAQLRKGVQS